MANVGKWPTASQRASGHAKACQGNKRQHVEAQAGELDAMGTDGDEWEEGLAGTRTPRTRLVSASLPVAAARAGGSEWDEGDRGWMVALG